MPGLLLEIAAFNMESARIAAAAGADRIELCSGLSEGGLTPSPAMIREAKEQLECPFFVMIRPRGGGFVYTPDEAAQMKSELLAAKEMGADGFVFGLLRDEDTIDEDLNSELVAMAHPLPCTFHRAFDDLADKHAALETLIRCGFQRVLTSGGTGNAIDHCPELQRLTAQAGSRIVVMPGGGVRSANLQELQEKTLASEFHSAAVIDGSGIADAATVRMMKKLLSLND